VCFFDKVGGHGGKGGRLGKGRKKGSRGASLECSGLTHSVFGTGGERGGQTMVAQAWEMRGGKGTSLEEREMVHRLSREGGC